MQVTPETTRPLLGEAPPSPKIDRDLVFARVEQRLLGRALEPVRLGRFVVLRRVGQGGMGVVYAAHDPELDRKVAVKLVDDGAAASDGRPELLREARAAAALTHPNVVTVYEVGVSGDAVFLAMEYVQGPTLREWLQAETRRWREVLAVFVAAGRGLAAAHRAGLVHRDFKPDNVLIGEDGRPRVADFGLARLAPQERTGRGQGDAPAGDGTFTAVAGTPRYMAPEQHEGRGIGSASDQFAFCVALYEALYGHHPFGGKGAAEMALRVLEGEVVSPGAAARKVPARVTRLVRKGLSRRPSERHADMEALLDGLGSTLLRRRRIMLGTAALVLSGVASVAGYQVAPVALAVPAQALDPCADAASPMRERWAPRTRTRLEAAFAATGEAGAEVTATLVADKLDRYAEEWSAMRERTCRATVEEGQRSELLMELGYACLERRLTGMTTLVDRFVTIDASTLARAANAVDELVPLASCEDRSELVALRGNALRGQTDRSARPEADRELEALHERLARGEALRSLGQHAEALELAQAVIEEARAGGLRPAEAVALGLRGRLRRETSELDGAWDDLRRAASLGLEGDLGEATIEALVGLSEVLRRRREGVEQAAVLLDLARGLTRRGPAPPVYALRVAAEQAKVDRLERRFDAARDGLQQALRDAEGLGSDHTLVLSARSDLAANLVDLGELAQAERIFSELLPRRIAAQGPQHRSVGTLLVNLGVVAHNQKRWEVAQGYYARGLEFYELAANARMADMVRYRQAIMRAEQGRLPEAEALLSRVLQERRERLGPEHADLAEVLQSLADVENDQGQREAAAEHAWQAVALLERAHGPDYFDLRGPLVTLGIIELERGHPAQAVVVLRRAHAIVYGAEVDGLVRGEVCFHLARALWADPSARREARALAVEASDLADAAGERAEGLQGKIRAWQAEHGA